MKPRVAVIDVGSNSIKALVAGAGESSFDLEVFLEATEEVRISQGIGSRDIFLLPDLIQAGITAVLRLCEECRRLGPLTAERIVATSAVRSAGNGHLFIEGVRALTGLKPQVLSGDEEADAIALGILTDPGIGKDLEAFTAFDLGGGSLELIRFENHRLEQRTSLPLGVVRLTEHFIGDPAQPVPENEIQALKSHVRDSIAGTGIPIGAPLIGCSGGLAVLRTILASRTGTVFPGTGVAIGETFIRDFAGEIRHQTALERMAIPGMPPQRADIFPAAMAVYETLLDLAGAEAILHSLHNLRYGLALGLLRQQAPV